MKKKLNLLWNLKFNFFSVAERPLTFFAYFLNAKKVGRRRLVISPAKAGALRFSHTRLPFPPPVPTPSRGPSPGRAPRRPARAFPRRANRPARHRPQAPCRSLPPPGATCSLPRQAPLAVAPRSHPGAQLRFILKQLYASGCPFLRNFPFFSSVPHPFFASAPGRTDTQKSAAGIPRRGFNTFSVSWLYFPLPNT